MKKLLQEMYESNEECINKCNEAMEELSRTQSKLKRMMNDYENMDELSHARTHQVRTKEPLTF